MINVEMPKANENLTEATLDRWLVKEGDRVAKDQSLCDLITDKAKFEMPSPDAGQVLKLLAPERALLPVGYVLCVLGAAGEAIPADLGERNAALLASHRAAATAIGSSAAAPVLGNVGASGVRATPAARRLAKELGVDLAELAKALKIDGPVNEKDVRAFADKKAM